MKITESLLNFLSILKLFLDSSRPSISPKALVSTDDLKRGIEVNKIRDNSKLGTVANTIQNYHDQLDTVRLTQTGCTSERAIGYSRGKKKQNKQKLRRGKAWLGPENTEWESVTVSLGKKMDRILLCIKNHDFEKSRTGFQAALT